MDSDNEEKGLGSILQSAFLFLTVKAVIEDCTAQLYQCLSSCV